MKLHTTVVLMASLLFFTGCGDSFYEVYNDITGPVQSVELRSSASVVVGSTERLNAVVYPSMTPNKNVTWESDNDGIASVDSTGLVTGNTVDQSTIIRVRTEDGGFTAECLVTVVPVPIPVETWTVDNSVSLGRGLQVQLTRDFTPANATNTEMSWRSSNSAVAAVDSTGLVIGVKTGTAVITVTSVHWGVSASCNVTVVDQALTVTYNANGGSGTVPVDAATYTAGATVTAAGAGSLSMAGHTFSHWNTKSDGTGSSVNQNGTFLMGVQNVTLYAIYSPILTYTVTYNANGGSGTSPVDTGNYTAGATVTAASAASLSMAGYSFSHWNTMANGSGISIAQNVTFSMGVQNVTLYAQWTPRIYHSVIFNKNNNASTGFMSNQQIEQGTSAALTLNGYSLAGWTFAGWSTSPSGGVVYNNGSPCPMGSSDVTLYAQWTPPATFNIGHRGPAGGIVFYAKVAYSNGWRYLEAAPADIAAFQWGSNMSLPSLQTGIGYGENNTGIIVYNDPWVNKASDACYNYSVINCGILYDDWFLPSQDELLTMLSNIGSSGTFPVGSLYWCSSIFDASSAIAYSVTALSPLTISTPYNASKSNSYHVRPIRAF